MKSAVAIADEALEQFRDVAFWNWRSDARATPENLSAIIVGLREHGGHAGYHQAARIRQAIEREREKHDNIHASATSPETGAGASAGQ